MLEKEMFEFINFLKAIRLDMIFLYIYMLTIKIFIMDM